MWSALYPPAAGTLVAGMGAALGVALAARGRLTRFLIPLSGVFLLLAAGGVLLPELASSLGWPVTLALAVAGFAALAAVDHLAFAVCPSCSHHNHTDELRLEGFAVPLLSAVAVHAFIDGWGLVAVQTATPGAGRSLTLAILLHKVPEGLTLGALTRASFPRAAVALAWCLAAEFATIIGGAAGLWLSHWQTGGDWLSYPLALAAGTFLFLGSGALGLRVTIKKRR